MKRALRIFLLFTFLFATVLAAACTKDDTVSRTKPVRISATKAFEKYFGLPPLSDKGSCYAFVIYFPSAADPGKVIPFPFFTFDAQTVLKVAVERLMGGMEVGTYKGEFMRPFPTGTHLLGLSEKGGTVIIDFSKEVLKGSADAKTEEALLDALALTVAQFDGVKGIRVRVEGREQGVVEGKEVSEFFGNGGLRRQPLPVDESAVREPGPPRLLSVTAVRDKGAIEVEDVSAYFDRPIKITELQMTDVNGKVLEGGLFQSVFDMAAVLKPKNREGFSERMPIKVRWKVIDNLGRRGEGEETRLLEIKEH